MEVQVDGNRLYCDKAKYSEARGMGIRECHNGYYIDLAIPGIKERASA